METTRSVSSRFLSRARADGNGDVLDVAVLGDDLLCLPGELVGLVNVVFLRGAVMSTVMRCGSVLGNISDPRPLIA